MIAIGSETIYLEIHSHAASAVALFVSALVYAGITAYVYYNTFMNVDRKEELKRWIKERR
jgi:archaellum component FlaF (FlaF/FlaG flagellin family)